MGGKNYRATGKNSYRWNMKMREEVKGKNSFKKG